MPNSQPETGPGTVAGIVAPPDLETIRPEWEALWRRCPGATPFQAPEWLLPWARHHAPGRCGAVALRREGRLVGLAPVFCWEGALLLAGTGPSDHADILLEPGAQGIAPLLLETLPQAAPGPFGRIEFQQIPPGSPALDAAAPGGWRDEVRPGDTCFAAPLTGEDGLGAVSKRQRANWRYGLRRLEREGGTVELAREDEIEPAMADLVRLHGLRWRERGEAGVLADPLLRRFLMKAAPELERAAMLRLWQVRLGGERIAVLMVLAGKRAHHYYIGGFDPAQAKLSASAVLIGAAMQAAHREGAAEFDFLRGAEPYKLRWGARERQRHRRMLVPRSG